MAKITRLTKAQKARFPEFVEKWTKIGLSTEPADRPRAERAIAALYTLANLAPPRIIWLPCPMSGMISAAVFARFMARQKSDAVGGAVRGAVGSAVGGAVGGAVGDAARSWFGGSLWAGYPAWADYFNEVLSIRINRAYLDTTESCGMYWPLNGVCFASERPSHIRLDGDGRLHAANGMAIQYPSGWGLPAWHGTVVPADWIERPAALKPETVLKASNLEQRRAGIDILGWDQVLTQLNARMIDADDDPMVGALLEVDLPDAAGRSTLKAQFLRVLCGTGRQFVIGVDPAANCKTALDAQAWFLALDKKDFTIPQVRT